ncbi:hypothetical protein B0H19DRAFT_1083237 [Mycena capillaripes]|nr:hypothetical protein B0H19DRAFT_1083237 [Mycena capillaripes]
MHLVALLYSVFALILTAAAAPMPAAASSARQEQVSAIGPKGNSSLSPPGAATALTSEHPAASPHSSTEGQGTDMFTPVDLGAHVDIGLQEEVKPSKAKNPGCVIA